MAYKQTIGQVVFPGNGLSEDNNLVANAGAIMRLSVYALPGCQINIDGSIITLNNTGLFNVDFPESMWGVDVEGITSVKVTSVTRQLLEDANTKMVIDYVAIKQSSSL